MGLYNEVRKGEARMHVPTAALLIARWGGATGPSDWSTRINHNTLVYQYRLCYTMPLCCTGSTITFSYILSTKHKSRLRIPIARWGGAVSCWLVECARPQVHHT